MKTPHGGILPVLAELLAFLLLGLVACQSPLDAQPQEPVLVQGVVSYPPVASGETTSTSAFPQSVEMSLSSAPKVGETAELTVRITQNDTREPQNRVTRTWLKFLYRNTEGTYQEYRNAVEVPMEEVLLSSTADWAGDLRAGSPLEFRIPMKLLKPGLWEIRAYAQKDDGTTVSGNRLYLGTTADKAGMRGTEADRLGQLEWMKDYRDAGGKGWGGKGYLIDTIVDFPHPPQLGETIQLKWTVTSAYDTGPVKVTVSLTHAERGGYRFEMASVDKVRVDGDLQWEGELNKGESVSGVATVVIPEEGDWDVTINCSELDKDSPNIYNYAQTAVHLSVSSSGGRWGWVESHSSPAPTSLPTIPADH